MRAFGSILTLLAITGMAHAGGGWVHLKDRNGSTYERREVPGSKFEEYRAIAHTSVSPEVALEAIWSELHTVPAEHITHRDVIRSTDTEMVIHDLVHAPVVSDREITLRFIRTKTPPYEVTFENRNDLGPPPDPKRVQLPAVRGAWKIEPEASGSKLTYTCYSEPGGSVPAFMVRSTQQDQVVKDVERLLTRMQRGR